MKIFCEAVFLVLVVSSQGKSLVKHEETNDNYRLQFIRTGDDLIEFERQLTVNMNDYVDKLLLSARKFMMENGLDPAQLPDVEKGFSATDLLGITWHGELSLTNGWAQDLSTIYRSGDVLVEYENNTLLITANMGFTDLTYMGWDYIAVRFYNFVNGKQFVYDFSAKIMNIGQTGNLDGKANQVQTVFKAHADLISKKVTLDDFNISNVGDVKVEVNGLGTVLNWIANGIVTVAFCLFKGPIMKQVEGIVRSAIEDALTHIDIGANLPNY